MKKLEISAGTGASRLLVGETLVALEREVPMESAIVITDDNVWKVCGNRFPDWPVIRIGTGEEIKTLDTVQRIYERLVKLEADRAAFVVGIGGGIVCDVSGFVASTYMRGLRFGFVATTLLSQVDASVGGKNGVNLGGYKNMVGVFNQPEFVICDLDLLKTLPQKEILCGFAEIVKHGAIGDRDLFELLEKRTGEALALNPEVIERVVYDSIVLKAAVVNRDEKETGERRKLNFGHTLGHAIEKVTGISHGEAVSAGMVFASFLSVEKGLLPKSEADRIPALLKKLGLPTRVTADAGRLKDALKRDKKREGQGVFFVLLSAIGTAVVEEISYPELSKALDRFTGKGLY